MTHAHNRILFPLTLSKRTSERNEDPIIGPIIIEDILKETVGAGGNRVGARAVMLVHAPVVSSHLHASVYL